MSSVISDSNTNKGTPPVVSKSPMIWIYGIVRILLGCIFFYSGLTKLLDPLKFSIIIESYGLIPQLTVWPVAITLSLLELVSGLGLILDVQWSLGIIAALLVLFMTILGYGIWLGLDVDCGCFGADDPEGEAYHSLRPSLYRDIGMFFAVIYLFLWRRMQSLHPIQFSKFFQMVVQRQRR